MKMTPHQFVRDTVLMFSTSIERSPKNRTAEFHNQAMGAINMAAALHVIDEEHASTARRFIRCVARWRGVCNFPNFEKWKEEEIAARVEFDRVWG